MARLRVVEPHAVDEHQRLTEARASNDEVGLHASLAPRAHVDARRKPQHVGQHATCEPLDVVARENRDRPSKRALGYRRGRGGHDDPLVHDWACLRCIDGLPGNRERQQQEKHQLGVHAMLGYRMPTPSRNESLVRAIGTFGLAAAIVNITIGSGIFRLPANVAGSLGAAAPLAYVICAVAMGLIVICIADAGKRVPLTGGPYAYISTSFGGYAGFMSGVLLWMLGVFASAAVGTVFASSVGALVPA